MAWIHVLEAVNGRRYTLDGISGTIEAYRDAARHRIVFRHEPDKRGRRSARYLEIKAQLRDHWSTDLSESDRAVQIAYDLLGEAECNRLCKLPIEVIARTETRFPLAERS